MTPPASLPSSILGLGPEGLEEARGGTWGRLETAQGESVKCSPTTRRRCVGRLPVAEGVPRPHNSPLQPLPVWEDSEAPGRKAQVPAFFLLAGKGEAVAGSEDSRDHPCP